MAYAVVPVSIHVHIMVPAFGQIWTVVIYHTSRAVSSRAIYANIVPAMGMVCDGRAVLWTYTWVFPGMPGAVIALDLPARGPVSPGHWPGFPRPP